MHTSFINTGSSVCARNFTEATKTDKSSSTQVVVYNAINFTEAAKTNKIFSNIGSSYDLGIFMDADKIICNIGGSVWDTKAAKMDQ